MWFDMRAIAVGGAYVAGGATLSLIDVLVAECRSGTLQVDEGGGGICVLDGSLNMRGGAIRDCHTPNGAGGGLNVMDPTAQVQLSSLAVQSCTALYGAGMSIMGGNVSLADIRFEDCVAGDMVGSGQGGGMSIEGGDVMLVNIRFERCQAMGRSAHGGAVDVRGGLVHGSGVHAVGFAFMGGGLTARGGTSTWLDSRFNAQGSQCIRVGGGTHMFIRIHASGTCTPLSAIYNHPAGAGLHVIGGSATFLDSLISDSSAVSHAGCVLVEGGSLALRNMTLKNCSAPKGPYISFDAEPGTLSTEMLTLETSCEVEQGGAALIHVLGESTAPLDLRGLRVHACASSRPMILDNGYRLLNCSDGGVCGTAATCTDVMPLPSAPNLTTVDCVCTGEVFPSRAAASAALAPYGFDSSIDYCVTPRVLTEVDLSGFVLEKVVRLSKTSSANAAHTLNLTMHIGGTDLYPADWTIEAASVPFWLSLPLHGNLKATEQTANLSMTANTTNLPERLATPHEALLNLSVASQRDKTVLVLIKLYVSAPTVARTSIWGTPNDDGVCDETTSEKEILEVQQGSPLPIDFSACDVDRLPVNHDDGASFEASLTDSSTGTTYQLAIAYTGYGRYTVPVDAPKMGLFLLRLSLASVSGTVVQVGVERPVRIVCAAGYYASVSSECVSCPPGTLCETIGIDVHGLLLQAGWWRISNTSVDIKRCPDYKSSNLACVGGEGAGAGMCKDTLDGPFCVLCSGGVGHYYDKDDKKCYECGADTRCVSSPPPPYLLSPQLPLLLLSGTARWARCSSQRSLSPCSAPF